MVTSFAMLTSLDGYAADASGDFSWAQPPEDVMTFLNERTRSVKTFVMGRRMYEVMAVWDTLDQTPGLSEGELEFAELWHAADKVVYSRTLPEVTTARTRLEREFTPESLRAVTEAAHGEVSIAGPTLAAQALSDGLVDEVAQYLAPVAVGGGLAFLPEHLRLDLELVENQAFTSGFVYVKYAVKR